MVTNVCHLRDILMCYGYCYCQHYETLFYLLFIDIPSAIREFMHRFRVGAKLWVYVVFWRMQHARLRYFI